MGNKLRLAVVMLVIVSIPSSALAIFARDYARTFRAHREEILSCAHGTHGTVTIQLELSPRGRVGWARVSSAQPEPLRAVGQCILARARTWQFDTSTSGGWRSYELSLTARDVSIRTSDEPIPRPPPAE